MKLNIVTAAANSVGNSLLKQIANPEDITIGLSRKGCDMPYVIDGRITDLINLEVTQRELLEILSKVDMSQIERVNIFHNCCLAKYEFPEQFIQYVPKQYIDKVTCYDSDGDGIDDGAYHTLITTFKNVFATIQPLCKQKQIAIGTICSLTDKKRVYSENIKQYISPSIFHSMVESNLILRNEISYLVQNNANIGAFCISAATVKTDTEDQFRKYSKDKAYWVSSEKVATELCSLMKDFSNSYIDKDVFELHPEWDKLSIETDEELTKRQLFDISNISL